MTHHDLIRMTEDSRMLGHPQSRQINPNRGPSRAPTGLNPGLLAPLSPPPYLLPLLSSKAANWFRQLTS